MQMIFSTIIIHMFIYLLNRHNFCTICYTYYIVKTCTTVLNSLIRPTLAKHIIKCTTVALYLPMPEDMCGFHNKVINYNTINSRQRLMNVIVCTCFYTDHCNILITYQQYFFFIVFEPIHEGGGAALTLLPSPYL